MAQAECITTAIRELLSRRRSPKSTSAVLAVPEFGAALGGHVPNAIHGEVVSEDLEGSDALEKMFAGLPVCFIAVILNITQNIGGSTVDRGRFDNLFQDVWADALCALRNAAQRMREHENSSRS